MGSRGFISNTGPAGALAAGKYLKHKGRLVCDGSRSRHGMHYFESSSQVMHSASAKMMASISTGEWGRAVEEARKKRGAQNVDVSEFDYMKVHTIDVSQAYRSTGIHGIAQGD